MFTEPHQLSADDRGWNMLYAPRAEAQFQPVSGRGLKNKHRARGDARCSYDFTVQATACLVSCEGV